MVSVERISYKDGSRCRMAAQDVERRLAEYTAKAPKAREGGKDE